MFQRQARVNQEKALLRDKLGQSLVCKFNKFQKNPFKLQAKLSKPKERAHKLKVISQTKMFKE